MKRFFTVIVAICYLITSSGFILDLHYCMGELVSMSIWQSKNQKCEKCGMPEKKGCCENKQYKLQLDKDQKSVTATSDLPKPNEQLQVFLYYSPSIQICQALNPDHLWAAPPGKEKQSVYLINCVFRI